jgi:hypothetical protein
MATTKNVSGLKVIVVGHDTCDRSRRQGRGRNMQARGLSSAQRLQIKLLGGQRLEKSFPKVILLKLELALT